MSYSNNSEQNHIDNVYIEEEVEEDFDDDMDEFYEEGTMIWIWKKMMI